MTTPTTTSEDLCRVTVVGPAARADLAVPVATPIASLLPVLLLHTGDVAAMTSTGDDDWVLQRLDGVPFEPGATPQSLDWHEGEVLYLRPSADRLPPMGVDDVADGIATAISAHSGRWRPEYNRWLFLPLTAAALGVLAAVLMFVRPRSAGAALFAVAAVVLLGLALYAAARPAARELSGLTGLGASVYAGLAGASIAVAAGGRPVDVLFGVAAATAVAGVGLLATGPARAGWPGAVGPVVVAGAALTAVAGWVHSSGDVPVQRIAGTAAVVLVAALFVAPRAAIRVAGIRAPQLPRTADELQQDIEPLPADEVERRARAADRYVTLVVVTVCLAVTASGVALATGPMGGRALAAVLAVALAVRARAARAAAQRVPFAVAAAAELGLLAVALAADRNGVTPFVVAGVLAVAGIALVLATVRPATRRLLPIWGHLANTMELVSAAALLPVLLQVLGVYAWARGLVG